MSSPPLERERRRRSYAHALEMVSDGAFVFLGTWTLIHQVSYLCGLTFVATWRLAWAGAVVGSFLWLRGPRPTTGADDGTDSRGLWALTAAVLIAVTLTVCLVRPDGDDEDYLGYSLLSLDYQSLPMTSTQPMQLGYALSSYNFLIASLSWVSGIPLLASYYFVWPTIMAVLVIVVQWRLYSLLRLRNPQRALLGLLVIMLAWGDAHRTPANFGLVRLFQGKAVLVSVLLSGASLYWGQFVERRDTRSILLLLLTCVAGVGFSPTGIPLGVVILGLFLVATLVDSTFRPDGKSLFGLFAPLTYLAIVGLTLRYHYGQVSRGIYLMFPAGVPLGHYARPDGPGFTSTYEMLGFVLGHGARAAIALVCVAALPLTLRASPCRRLLAIYSIGCTALMLFPWTSQWLAQWSFSTASWRWLYAVPFVLAMLCALDRIDDLRLHVAVRRVLVVLTLAVFVLVSPHWVLSAANWTHIEAPSYKTADPTTITIRPYQRWVRLGGSAPLESQARIEGPWLVSPLTGRRY